MAAVRLERSARLDYAPAVRGATPVSTTDEGFTVWRGTATLGDIVLHYPEDDPPVSEYRATGEALSDAAVASMVWKPVTVGSWDAPTKHPPRLVVDSTAKHHMAGTVLKAWREDDALRVEFVVYAKELNDAIRNGVVELSPGYRRDPVKTSGVHEGQRFDVVQTNVRYNHLQVVDRARTRRPDGEVARIDQAPPEHAMKIDQPTPAAGEANPSNAGVRADGILMLSAEALKALGDLKAKLAEEDVKILDAMMSAGVAMAGAGEASGVMLPPPPLPDAPVGDALPPLPPSNAPGETGGEKPPMDEMLKKMDGIVKRLDALDARMNAPAPAAARSDSAAVPVDLEAVRAEALRMRGESIAVMRATAEADGRLLERARLDGVEAFSPQTAAAGLLARVAAHTPKMKPLAEDALKGGRMDAFYAYCDQAEEVRRAALNRDQESTIFGAFRADAHPGPIVGGDVVAPRVTFLLPE